MYIPDKLKLNKFQSFKLPSARDLFKLTGERVPNDSEYSGDEVDKGTLSKVEASEAIRNYAEVEVKKIKSKKSDSDK